MNDLRCCQCGHFCNYGSDSGAPFVSGDVYEPPDDQYWCDSCAKKNEEYYVKLGWMPNYWYKPLWTIRGAVRLGLVQIKQGINGWTVWHKKSEPLPTGWQEVA